MSLLQAISDAWGWTGLRPRSVVEADAFGDVIVLDEVRRYWRVCPEELSCEEIAENEAGYELLRASPEFERDWTMAAFHEAVRETLGPVADGRCYCLKIPAVLGGVYSASNAATISLDELTLFSGHVALQIKDLPDGAQIRLKIDP